MAVEPTLGFSSPATFAARHLRRNFGCLVLDFGTFGVGMSFASTATIIPALAERLGASNLIIGAIPAISILGFALPPLFYANYTERVRAKLPFILKYTVWERLPFLMLAALAYFLAEREPAVVVAGILLALATMSAVGGALMPAWMDLIAKAIPATYRGRLMAFSSTIGAGLGMGGAAVAGYYLATYRYPLNYSLCLLSGFVFLMLSWVALAMVKEPMLETHRDEMGFGAYARRLPTILRRDRDFSLYLVARAVGSLAGMAGGFYAVFALRDLAAPEYQVARFTLVLLAGQTAAGLLFGYLADHLGHKPVLVVGMLATVLGNLVALLAGSIWHVYAVFFFVSVSGTAGVVSALNLAMEFAPEAERPTYIGLATTLIAPLGFASSLIAGLLADVVGYRVVFAVAGTFAVAAALVLALWVRDPRRVAREVTEARSA